MGALVATHHELVKGFVKSLGLDPKTACHGCDIS